MPQRLYREIMAALQPYEHNHNTGVNYEIATLLWIARAAGLTEAEYGNVAAYLRRIAKKNQNTRITEKRSRLFEQVFHILGLS